MDWNPNGHNSVGFSGREKQTTQIYEGTNQIQRIVIARGLLDLVLAWAPVPGHPPQWG